MKAYFKQLFEYDKWANDILLDRFEKQFPVNPRIYELFSHTLSAGKVWLDRVMGVPQSVAVWSDRLPEEIKADNESYNLEWLEFIDGLEPEGLEKTVRYTNTQGDTFDTKLADIITHVINHGTHHRGNIITLMKEEGFAVPHLDFILFVRGK